jgi:hypothetical protein
MVDAPEVVLTFTYERETKNTVRFQEIARASDEPMSIGALYMQKWLYRRLTNPKTLTVRISQDPAEARARRSSQRTTR